MTHELKSALRQLGRHRLYALVVVLTLGLGIGANTAIFSLVYGLVLRPLPYDDEASVVRVRQVALGFQVDDVPFSVPEIEDYRSQASRLAGLAEFHAMEFTLFDAGRPERVRTGVVSSGYFDVLGVEPIHGRGLSAADEEPGADPVLLLDHSYWRQRFGGDRSVIGRRLEMNDLVLTVIGVLPPLPPYPAPVDVYVPTTACPFRADPDQIQDREGRMMSVVARLAPGAGEAAAQSELSAIAERLVRRWPHLYGGGSGYGIDVTPVKEDIVRDYRRTLALLFVAVGLLLVIACANVANLALASLLRRQGQLTLRAVLGAGRGRIVRLVLLECVLLALGGGLLGAVLALVGTDLLVAFAARFTERPESIAIHLPVLLFTLGASIVSGALFGLGPALWASRENLATALREAGTRTTPSGGARWLRSGLVVAQVAVSFSLLVAAGLTLRSFAHLDGVDPGFDGSRVATLEIPLSFDDYRQLEQRVAFERRVTTAARSLPGVVAVAFSSDTVLQEAPGTWAITPESRASPPGAEAPLASTAHVRRVGADYFEAVGTPILSGRSFEDRDGPEAPPVAIVSRVLGERLWPGVDPVGQRLRIGDDAEWVTVVGAAGDTRSGLDRGLSEDLYLPYAQNPVLVPILMARTEGDPMAFVPRLREVLRSVDPAQPVGDVTTLERLRARSIAPARLSAALLGLFALAALLIAATGVGAAMAFMVGERRREIGVRMALGARGSEVQRMVVRQGMGFVLAGLLVGGLLALAVGRSLESALHGVAPLDPWTWAGTALALAAIAAAACLAPARRAAAVDPMVVLRTE